MTLDREQLQEPLAPIDGNVLVQERPAAEAFGEDDRHVLTWRAYAFPFVGTAPLVSEESSESDPNAFGISAAVLTASI